MPAGFRDLRDYLLPDLIRKLLELLVRERLYVCRFMYGFE